MTMISTLFSRFRRRYAAVLGLILLACFLLNSLSIKSYGESYDETLIHEYANINVQSYLNLIFNKPYEKLTEFYDLRYYGPAFWIGAKITALPLQAVFPALDEYDAWHIVNFATFLLGAWCLFCLGRRFTSQPAALAAALLYLTQPLLWGHGVMNPKDIPFMTFFLASVLTGVRMVEEAANPAKLTSQPLNLFRRGRKYLTGLALLVAGLALADLLSGHFLSRPPISIFVTQAYSAGTANILHSLFLQLAAHSDGIPAASYIDKALQIVQVAEFAILLLILSGGLAIWLTRTSARNRWIVLAGVTAGVTISIRVLGPAAMGLVTVYAIASFRRRAVGLLLFTYLGISLVTAYAAWPYLWNDPIGRFWESFQVMANFPWSGTVRFEGGNLEATALPWYYLPKLMAIQLTLPLLALAAAGLAIFVHFVQRRGLDLGLAAIPLLWFLAPMGGVLLLHPSMYDNFRQFLFILPPLFLFAAMAVEVVFRHLRTSLWKGAFCLAVLLPGIMAGAWLHPYEYVYYNALVGWTGQVDR